jgi:hypothetical protein
MGLWPTRGNENLRRRPRAGGDPSWVGRTMDSRFRGNDTESVIFRRDAGDEESQSELKTLRARFLHFVQYRLFAALRMAAKDSE